MKDCTWLMQVYAYHARINGLEPIQGQRTIIRHVDPNDGHRSYQGSIAPVRPRDEHLRQREWWDRTIEKVVDHMNRELGEVPDTQYEVVE